MANETVNDISIENEESENEFDYCSEFFLLKKCSKIWSQKRGKKRRLCAQIKAPILIRLCKKSPSK